MKAKRPSQARLVVSIARECGRTIRRKLGISSRAGKGHRFGLEFRVRIAGFGDEPDAIDFRAFRFTHDLSDEAIGNASDRLG